MTFHNLAKAIFLAVSISGIFLSPAKAADVKIISSAICQAMTPEGVSKLKHNGSSLQALDVAVTVICPVIKDNHGPLASVEVRHLRPNGASGQVVQGKVFSCSTLGGCSESAQASSSATNKFTSVFVNTAGLPQGGDRYYFYKSVLPAGWKIVAFKFTQS